MRPFTLAVTGNIIAKDLTVSAGDLSGAEDMLAEEYGGQIHFEDAEVTEATVTVEARIRLDSVEVEASDMSDFDPAGSIQEATSWDVQVSNAEFEVEDGPDGWNVVENLLGQDSAIELYATLALAGLDII